MADWATTATLPAFESAHLRRRKTIREVLGDDLDEADATIALALLSTSSLDQDRVALPVRDGERWLTVEVDLDPLPSIATLREDARRQLAEPATIEHDPPPGCTVVARGDSLVDAAHLTVRISGSRATIEGPVEPVGAVQVLAERLRWLLGEIAADRSLVEIEPCGPDELATLTELRVGEPVGTLRLTADLIERSGRRAPHTPALSTPWVTWTYDELLVNAADRFAMLQRNRIAPGDVVALHLARTPDLVATMLALWQIGATIVPVSGNHPRSRLRRMLDDVGATAVVTDHGDWRSPETAVDTVELDRSIRERRIGRRRIDGPALDDPAYVLFTSGTTGRPKGIRVSHRNLAHYLRAVSPVIPRSGWPAVMLAITPLTFDPSLLELVWPLTVGWEVVIAPGRDIPIGPVARRRRVTHLNGTPTMASLMLHDRDGREVLETVRHVLLGGEPVRAELVRELGKVTRADVTVCYGPTECTVDVTWGAADPAAETSILPIGRPLPGHRVDVVDRRGRSVGAFTHGELVVSGDAVADGYVVEPAGPSPFITRDGRRSFRTGDVVWSDPTGTLHFVGRRDGQIKIRGHRIEIDEVDGRLLAHRGVRAAASVVVGSGDARRIESFVVVADAGPDGEELSTWMERTLPDPMVPARIHRLDELPRSASDKTDRGALVVLAESLAAEHIRRRPLTSTEEAVAGFFEAILDVAEVPPDRTIFELGGNSVSAVRLVSELESLTGDRVALASLLDTGSVERIAEALDAGTLGAQGETLVTIVADGYGLPVYCVAGADGHAIHLRPLGEAVGRPFHGLEFAGTDGITPPDTTVGAMAERFVQAVETHHRAGPLVLAGYSGGGLVALEMAKRLAGRGAVVALLILIDTMNPMLQRRTMSRKVFDGLRELGAPDDRGPISVLRNRLMADRLSRDENLFAAIRKGRVPNVVDLTPEFERAVDDWEPPSYDGRVLVVRSAAVVPAYRGWERVVTGPLEAVSIPHGHVRMMVPPHVDDLAAAMREAIETVEGPLLP